MDITMPGTVTVLTDRVEVYQFMFEGDGDQRHASIAAMRWAVERLYDEIAKTQQDISTPKLSK